MPKQQRGVNKAQAIRDMLTPSPQLSAKEVVDRLASQQIQVKPSMVYMIKGRITQLRAHQRIKAARVARAGQKTGSADPQALVLKIKELAQEAGGIGNLKALVAALAK
jgi:hypothetical protein